MPTLQVDRGKTSTAIHLMIERRRPTSSRPMKPQTIIQLHREQREHSPEYTPHDRIGCECTGCEERIAVDKVHVDPGENEQKTTPKRDRSEDRHNPMNVGGRSPSEDQKADGEHDSASTSHG